MTTDREERAGALDLLKVLFPETWATRSNALEHVIAYGDARAAQAAAAEREACAKVVEARIRPGNEGSYNGPSEAIQLHHEKTCRDSALAIRERETK